MDVMLCMAGLLMVAIVFAAKAVWELREREDRLNRDVFRNGRRR